MAEYTILTRRVTDVGETRGTPRVIESPPTPVPSVHILVSLFVSLPANMVSGLATPRVHATSLDLEKDDRPVGLSVVSVALRHVRVVGRVVTRMNRTLSAMVLGVPSAGLNARVAGPDIVDVVVRTATRT